MDENISNQQLNDTKTDTGLHQSHQSVVEPQPQTNPQPPLAVDQSSGKKPFAKMIPFFILGLLFLGLVVFLLSKFVFKNDDDIGSGPITLTYWGLWEPESVIQGAIAEFEKENPNIKIDYRKNSKTD
jgi:hypothetical protein